MKEIMLLQKRFHLFVSRTVCIFQIPVIPVHTSIKWSSKSNLNHKSTILILQLSQYIHFPKKIYTFYPISDQESRQCHSYEVIVYYVSFWLLIICKRIKHSCCQKICSCFEKNCEKNLSINFVANIRVFTSQGQNLFAKKNIRWFFCYSLYLWSLVYLMTTMTLKYTQSNS